MAAHFITESKSCYYQVFVVELEPFSNSRTLLLRCEVGLRAQRLLVWAESQGHIEGRFTGQHHFSVFSLSGKHSALFLTAC